MRSFLKKNIVVVFCCLCLLPGVAAASSVGTVVFYPTDVTEAGELAYLRDSVRLMLASRLAASSGIQPQFEEGTMAGMHESYQLQSRLVSDGAGVTLSAKVLAPDAESSLSFQVKATTDTQVMKAVDDLVTVLGTTLFSMAPTSVPAADVVGKKAVTDFHTPHPDRQIKANSGYGLAIYQEADGLPVRTTGLYKSAILPGVVKGMTAGDLDGDGLVEILLATDGKLNVYQLRNGRIQHLKTIALPGFLRVHGLNVADLTGNGLMEIYISATRRQKVCSYILEWNPQGGVSWLYKEVPRYLRPVNLPEEGWTLLSQNSGVEDLVGRTIRPLDFGLDGKLVDGEPLLLPEGVNLFEFVYADTNGNGSSEVVTINKKWQLQIFGAELNLLFTTETGYGGRSLIIGPSKEELEDLKEFEMAEKAYVYVPIRLIAADINKDGKEEIIFVENERYSPGLLGDTLLFRNGVARMLTWDGLGLVELFHTNTMLNSVLDFQFFMIEGEEKGKSSGQLFVVEPKSGDALTTLVGGGRGNRVLAYNLDMSPVEP